MQHRQWQPFGKTNHPCKSHNGYSDHTYSLIRILDDRVITEPEEHEDKEIHSEEDIVYHDKYPFNKYEMEKELYSECMDVLHKLEFTITLLKGRT